MPEQYEGVAERVAAEFAAKRPLYEQLTTKLRALLEELLAQEGIGVHVIEARTKAVDSLRHKLANPNKAYKELDEIEDLAGVRVIAHYTTDVERVSALLHREFRIESGASEETSKRLAPDQFGYLSVHHVLTMSAARSSLSEWKHVANLKTEVQVRTIGQHAWAAISHALQYKRENDPPLASKRRLARLASLLELVDEESERLRAEHETRADKVAALLKRGQLRIPIDSESLQQYLKLTPHIKSVSTAAHSAGFSEPPENLHPLPSLIVSEVVAFSRAIQLATLEDIDSILRENDKDHFKFFAALIEAVQKEGSGKWSGTDGFFVMLSILYSKHKLVTPDLLVAIGWHKAVANRVLRVARSLNAKRIKASVTTRAASTRKKRAKPQPSS